MGKIDILLDNIAPEIDMGPCGCCITADIDILQLFMNYAKYY